MSTHKRNSQRRITRLWLAAGAALLVLGAMGVYMAAGPSNPAFAPQGAGAPHLAADRTVDDRGDVPYDQVVRSTFRLENTGDQPLQILRQPQVEVVEGC